MWECKYGKEPLNTRLFVLRLLKKIPVIMLAAILGALLVGGPYFLVKVTFGPAKEYEAVTDFYIDYALQADGTPHTYINFATWDQLLKDDVFTDRILSYMSETEKESAEAAEGEGVESTAERTSAAEEMEKSAGVTKEELRGYLSATVLSDTRIATTTVTTNDPDLTMKIERALVQAMLAFGEEQKEIAEIRILQEPEEASLVAADVRTFRACMVGAVLFVFAVVLYLCLYYALDEGISVPEIFERRYGIPMLGTIHGKELPVLAEKLSVTAPTLLTADKAVDLKQVESALSELGIKAAESYRLEELFGTAGHGGTTVQETSGKIESPQQDKEGWDKTETSLVDRVEKLAKKEILLVVKADAHNGKLIEKTLDFCKKCGISIRAALLWEADEKLIKVYEMPEHVFRAWKPRRS